MSVVHYKFKSSKDYDTITFDGSFISLGDLKRSIISQKKLGRLQDCGLMIQNAQTNEEYKDDAFLVPKNTSVIVKRVPIFRSNSSSTPSNSGSTPAVSYIETPTRVENVPENAKRTEAEKLKDLVNQQTSWIPKGSFNKYQPNKNTEQRIPPASYICHRCNQPGHYINHCPTNGDPNFDFHKVKKPTGIPRSFLKPVEGGNSKGTLLMPGGGFAIMTPNSAEFDKVASVTSSLPEFQKKIPPELQCPICQQLFRDAVLISCCGNSFCGECIQQVLEESKQMVCPSCQKQDVTPEQLVVNKQLRQAIENYKRIITTETKETPTLPPTAPGPIQSTPILATASTPPIPSAPMTALSAPSGTPIPQGTTNPIASSVSPTGISSMGVNMPSPTIPVNSFSSPQNSNLNSNLTTLNPSAIPNINSSLPSILAPSLNSSVTPNSLLPIPMNSVQTPNTGNSNNSNNPNQPSPQFEGDQKHLVSPHSGLLPLPSHGSNTSPNFPSGLSTSYLSNASIVDPSTLQGNNQNSSNIGIPISSTETQVASSPTIVIPPGVSSTSQHTTPIPVLGDDWYQKGGRGKDHNNNGALPNSFSNNPNKGITGAGFPKRPPAHMSHGIPPYGDIPGLPYSYNPPPLDGHRSLSTPSHPHPHALSSNSPIPNRPSFMYVNDRLIPYDDRSIFRTNSGPTSTSPDLSHHSVHAHPHSGRSQNIHLMHPHNSGPPSSTTSPSPSHYPSANSFPVSHPSLLSHSHSHAHHPNPHGHHPLSLPGNNSNPNQLIYQQYPDHQHPLNSSNGNGSDRSRSRSRSLSRSPSRSRSRSRSRKRGRSRSRSRSRRSRSRSRSKSPNRKRSRSRSRSEKRQTSRKSQRKRRSRSHSRNRSNSPSRSRSKSRGGHKRHQSSKSRSKSRSRSRSRSPSQSPKRGRGSPKQSRSNSRSGGSITTSNNLSGNRGRSSRSDNRKRSPRDNKSSLKTSTESKPPEDENNKTDSLNQSSIDEAQQSSLDRDLQAEPESPIENDLDLDLRKAVDIRPDSRVWTEPPKESELGPQQQQNLSQEKEPEPINQRGSQPGEPEGETNSSLLPSLGDSSFDFLNISNDTFDEEGSELEISPRSKRTDSQDSDLHTDTKSTELNSALSDEHDSSQTNPENRLSDRSSKSEKDHRYEGRQKHEKYDRHDRSKHQRHDKHERHDKHDKRERERHEKHDKRDKHEKGDRSDKSERYPSHRTYSSEKPPKKEETFREKDNQDRYSDQQKLRDRERERERERDRERQKGDKVPKDEKVEKRERTDKRDRYAKNDRNDKEIREQLPPGAGDRREKQREDRREKEKGQGDRVKPGESPVELNSNRFRGSNRIPDRPFPDQPNMSQFNDDTHHRRASGPDFRSNNRSRGSVGATGNKGQADFESEASTEHTLRKRGPETESSSGPIRSLISTADGISESNPDHQQRPKRPKRTQ